MVQWQLGGRFCVHFNTGVVQYTCIVSGKVLTNGAGFSGLRRERLLTFPSLFSPFPPRLTSSISSTSSVPSEARSTNDAVDGTHFGFQQVRYVDGHRHPFFVRLNLDYIV